jgi:biopolymer transport protein ExbB/TolQ
MQGIAEFFEHGGLFMYINLLCSVATIAIIVERTIFFLGKGSVNARAFLEQIRKLVTANNVDRAVKLCSATEAPVARVAKAGLTRLPKGEVAVSTAIEEMLVDVGPELKKRIPALWSVANIATLFGLLGTISGLIRSFAAVGSASPEQRSALLSKGIAEAMYNTAFGLGIAVVCMVAHVFLSGVSKKQQGDLESFAMKLENMLAEAGHTASGQAQQAR